MAGQELRLVTQTSLRPDVPVLDIAGLVCARASSTPNRPAFVDGFDGSGVTWHDVAAQAGRLTELGRAADASRQPVLGLLLSRPTVFCCSYLAALAAGLCVVPLDPRSTPDELSWNVVSLGLDAVVVDEVPDDRLDALISCGANVFDSNGARQGGQEGRVEGHPGAPTPGPAVILTTSGTTGQPKLVPLAEQQLLFVAAQVAGHHRLSAEDRGYCPLPLFHINGQVVGILSTLVSGGSLVVDQRFNRDRFWDTVECVGATWLNLVPALLAVAAGLDPPGRDLSARVRFARSASSALPDPVRTRFESASGIGVLETYGMTEAASQITANPLQRKRRRAGSAGLPVGTRVRIVGEDGRTEAPPGAVGTVEIRGPGVVRHYLRTGRQAPTIPSRTPAGWLRTGDLGALDADGFLYLAGRSDDVINRGGEKVYPREIEEVLLSDPRVTSAAVVGRPHPILGAEPVAFLTTSVDRGRGEADAVLADVGSACASTLSRYKRPVEIRIADVLPTGATGKVARQALSQEVAGRIGAG
jgi:acyl-CoA synthetase (AMP-forming)/AMP-acid ligase II